MICFLCKHKFYVMNKQCLSLIVLFCKISGFVKRRRGKIAREKHGILRRKRHYEALAVHRRYIYNHSMAALEHRFKYLYLISE